MGSIIGATVTIHDFFDASHEIVINVGQGDYPTEIRLSKSRKYLVPAYQREIRWENAQVEELIKDLLDGSAFLGNVILNSSKEYYEIIDGQQRISVLLMIIDYIQQNIPDKDSIKPINPCKLFIESFKTFDEFRNLNYGTKSIDNKTLLEITSPENDVYLQNDRYEKLWHCLEKCLGDDADKMMQIYNSLYNCDINLLIFKDERNPNVAINRFIDVNQKGVKLDSEDKLKGYIFQYNVDIVNPKWIQIKQNCCLINKDKQYYPLMTLFEQYFYSNNIKLIDEKLSIPEFKKDLTLKTKWQGYSAGTHLMKALKNRILISEHLDIMIRITSILKDICCCSYPSEFYQNLFIRGTDYEKKKLLFYLCKTVIMSNNNLPKIYLLNYLKESFVFESNGKKNYDSVFTVYIYTLLFNLYSDIARKRENVYTYAKQDNWHEELSKQIESYFNSDGSKFVEKNAFVHYSQNMNDNPEDTRRDIFEFQAFACIYNFLHRKDNGEYTLGKKGENDKLRLFISDKESFSLEHFLLNDSKKFMIKKGGALFTYPTTVNKYIGGLFNFIYINRKINGDVLGNLVMPAKIEILTGDGVAYDDLDQKTKDLLMGTSVNCDYSKMVINTLSKTKPTGEHEFFNCYWECYKAQDSDALKDYFSSNYANEYADFMQHVLCSFSERFIKLKNKK